MKRAKRPSCLLRRSTFVSKRRLMKPVAYLHAASAEMERSVVWYEKREEGLGLRLHTAIKEAELFISKNPNLGTPHRRNTRKWAVPDFPYSLIYREEAERILICAV